MIKSICLFSRLAYGVLLLGGLSLSITVQAAPPENYFLATKKPLTIVIPRGQGGGAHQLSKQMAAELKKIIGVPVQLENRPEKDGIEAIEYVMSQPADGYIVLQHVDDIVSTYVRKDHSFHPTKDLTPIAITQVTFSQVYVRNIEQRFNDWKSFIAYTQANPKQVKISLVGHEGSMESIFLEMLTEAYKLDIVPQTYNKPDERYLSLVEGKADALIEQPGDVRPFLDRKLIKPILTLLPQRVKNYPDVASLADAPGKYPELYRTRLFLVPGKTPPERIAYLEWAFKQGYDSKEFQKFNEQKYMNLVQSYYNTEAATKFLNEMLTTYQDLAAKEAIKNPNKPKTKKSGGAE